MNKTKKLYSNVPLSSSSDPSLSSPEGYHLRPRATVPVHSTSVSSNTSSGSIIPGTPEKAVSKEGSVRKQSLSNASSNTSSGSLIPGTPEKAVSKEGSVRKQSLSNVLKVPYERHRSSSEYAKEEVKNVKRRRKNASEVVDAETPRKQSVSRVSLNVRSEPFNIPETPDGEDEERKQSISTTLRAIPFGCSRSSSESVKEEEVRDEMERTQEAVESFDNTTPQKSSVARALRSSVRIPHECSRSSSESVKEDEVRDEKERSQEAVESFDITTPPKSSVARALRSSVRIPYECSLSSSESVKEDEVRDEKERSQEVVESFDITTPKKSSVARALRSSVRIPYECSRSSSESVKEEEVRDEKESTQEAVESFSITTPKKSNVVSAANSPSPLKTDASGECGNLLEVLSSQSDVQHVVEHWIALYKRDAKDAMLKLIRLLFDLTGLQGELTVEDLEAEDGYKSLLKTFVKVKPVYMEPPVAGRRTQVLISVFLQLLIQKCDSLIFDSYLLDTVFSVVAAMSRDQLRVYRVVGTMAALKCMTPLLNVEIILKKQLSMSRRQLEMEESKDSSTQAPDRIESLNNMISALEHNEKYLRGLLLDYAVKAIFRERVLDTFPEIQVLCLNELCVWMEMDKEIFMVDRFLAYYKLLLTIPNVSVRRACLKSIRILYEKDTYVEQLKVFTEKCTPELVTMTLDRSIEVSVLALNILECILKLYGTTILQKHSVELFFLVFSHHSKMAEAAGSFLIAWLRHLHVQQTGNECPSRTVLLNLAEFFEEADLPEHAPYLVDALLPTCAAMQEWDVAASLLTNDQHSADSSTSSDGDLTLEREQNLLKLVSAAVRQVCSGVSPRASERAIAGRARGKKESAKVIKMRRQKSWLVTDVFLPELPRLLLKYRSDADKVCLLLGIAEFFLLKRVTSRVHQHLSHLARVFGSLVEIHGDVSVVGGCNRIMKRLADQVESPMAPFVLEWEAVQDKHYCNFMKELDDMGACFRYDQIPSTDRVFTLGRLSGKLVVLHEHRGVGGDRFWNVTLNYIIRARKISVFPGLVVLDMIKLCHLSLLHNWKMQRGEEGKEAEDVTSLKNKVLQFLYVLEELIQHQDRDSMVLAFLVLCDVLLVFGEQVHHPDRKSLNVPVTENIQESLRGYLERNVFMAGKSSKVRQFKSNALKAYIKLFESDILKFEYISWLLEYCGDAFEDFHDVLKVALTLMLDYEEHETVLAVGNTLNACLTKLHDQQKPSDTKKTVITEKFSLLFSCLQERPETLAKFHVMCMHFAFESDKRNIFLFDILSDSVENIQREQCHGILKILREYEENSISKMKCVVSYRSSISKNCKALASRKMTRNKRMNRKE